MLMTQLPFLPDLIVLFFLLAKLVEKFSLETLDIPITAVFSKKNVDNYCYPYIILMHVLPTSN